MDRIIYSQQFTMLQMMDTKFIETCKVELANNILKFTIQNHVSKAYQAISFAILYTYMYNYVKTVVFAFGISYFLNLSNVPNANSDCLLISLSKQVLLVD